MEARETAREIVAGGKGAFYPPGLDGCQDGDDIVHESMLPSLSSPPHITVNSPGSHPNGGKVDTMSTTDEGEADTMSTDHDAESAAA